MKPFSPRSALRSVGLILAMVSFASPAFAEAGDGIESKDFRLNLGLDVLAGVNSNLFWEDGNQATTPVPKLRISPSLDLSTIDPKSVDFNLGLGLGFDGYLGDQIVQDQSGFSARLATSAHINPKGALSLKIEDVFTRTNDPTNKPGNTSFNRVLNSLGGALGIHPGGRAIQGWLNYHWMVYNYDLLADNKLSSLNKDEHRFLARALWQFLPKSAAFLDVDWRLVRYDFDRRTIVNTDQPTSLLNTDSSPLRLRTGVNGLFTNGFGLRLLAGYGWGFYDAGAQPSGFLLNAEAAYYFGNERKSSVRLGFERDWHDSMLGNYYNSNRPYAAYQQYLNDQKFSFNLEASLDFRDYVILTDNGGQVGANLTSGQVPGQIVDTVFSIDSGIRYDFAKWMYAGLDYTFRANFTDDNIIVISSASEVQGRDYLQNIIMARFGLRY